MLAALLNGQRIDITQPALHVDDRGLLYGDGLFETLRLRDGHVRFLADHFSRLKQGCERLHLPFPNEALLQDELAQLLGTHTDGVVKLVLTRGRGGRGYRPTAELQPSRLWQLFAVPPSVEQIRLRWCETRLSRNALLAGIKHLNRLEQVLAQAEWQAVDITSDIAEGLMLDTEGELICGTMSNVFLLLEGTLVTPDLRYSGVAGVMRRQVLQAAERSGLSIEVRSVWPAEVLTAEEVFITNAVRGIQSVVALDAQQWPVGRCALALRTQIES